MKSKFEHIKQEDRKTILILCDDIRMHSGIATMAREIVLKSAHHFNWVNLGAAMKHPETGKLIDISGDVNKIQEIDDAFVKVIPNDGYGNAEQVRSLIKQFNPDAIFIFTDPRYWTWLFEVEREIRQEMPIMWLNIWDDYPAPMYNNLYYNSVDLLMAISKQTKNINELVLGEEAKNKVLRYVPHGIDDKVFRPILETGRMYKDLLKAREDMFEGKDIEYVVFFNSRNIQRKRPSDLILAYKIFCDNIGKEAAKKCALVMKTEVSSNHGTDLRAVKEAITDSEYVNIYFIQDRLTPAQMNFLYNVADVTVLPSSNEGWGLSLTESMLAGTMIIANVTGGMQDQMRFVDDKGEWYTPSADIPSNHRGTYKEHGEWARPVFPTNISIAGSPSTPYIYDDRCQAEDVAEQIGNVYAIPKEVRDEKGKLGRKWAMSEEAQMTADRMADNVIDCMNESFDKFVPRPAYDIFLAEVKDTTKVKHKLTGY